MLLTAVFFWSMAAGKLECESTRFRRYELEWQGAFFGLVGALMLALGGEASASYGSGFLAPIALSALRGKPGPPLIAGAVTTLACVALAGQGTAATAVWETAAVGLGASLAAIGIRHQPASWIALPAFMAAAAAGSAAWRSGGWSLDWGSLAGYAAWTCAVLLLSEWIQRTERARRALLDEYTYLKQHDMLTGLLNFQTFQDKLQAILREEGHRVCFILIDCDDVKSLNSVQGFQTVDGRLKRVAELLREHFPEANLIGRFGSDEFAVLLPQPVGGETALERILDEQIPKQADIRLSYGWAVYPDEEQDPGAFVSLAQRRMLETKRRLWMEREAHWLHSERLMAVGELAAGMAHEIRNPLTTVKGFLQVSKQNSYNVADYYDIIMHEIKRMSDLTGEFLQFSKPTALSPSLLTLQECVQAAIQLTESEIAKNGHQLHIHAEETPVQAFLEKDKLVQVLVNLIRNGMDAMAERSGALTVSVYSRGEFGFVDVTDTGGGISDDHLVRLFQPFFTTKSKGTGLGLSISQRIINDHGGFISVRSKVGVGSTFTIRLPLADRVTLPE